MADRVLLALTSSPEGGPACLLKHAGAPILTRLVEQLARDGRVTVVTWQSWMGDVRAASAGSRVVGVSSHGDVIRSLIVERGRSGGGDLLLAHAHLVASDLALGRVGDAAASGTSAVTGPPETADGTPVRITRGRIVAAASPHHTIDHASGVCQRALRMAAGVGPRADELLTELAGLVDDRSLAEAVPADGCGSRGDCPGDQLAGVDPHDDLVASVLVALVRGGIPVGATALPAGSVWAHPRTGRALREALEAVASLDEERQRLDAAVKSDDGFFTTFFVSSYSRYWARWAARRGFTPNQVTSVSMLLGILAALAFAAGTRWWALVGAVVLQLAFTLDCVDGQLARYSRRFSTLGAWLDSVFDRGKEYVVYAGLAVGGIRAGDEAGLWLLAGAALALQTFRHTLDLGYAEQQLADVDAAVVQPLAVRADRGPSFWEATAGPAAAPGSAATHDAAGALEFAPVDDPAESSRNRRPGGSGAVPPRKASLPRRLIGWLRRAEGVGVLRWGKRIVVLPIGERFALISVVAVMAGPRAVFVTLLAWGSVATAYTAGGRVVRSIA